MNLGGPLLLILDGAMPTFTFEFTGTLFVTSPEGSRDGAEFYFRNNDLNYMIIENLKIHYAVLHF